MCCMFNDLKKNMSEFVEINNEYIKIKVQEEKIKVSFILIVIFSIF